MGMLSTLFAARKLSPAQKVPSRRLEMEVLEDRFAPSCSVISGYVYNDANNNGLFGTDEKPISGVTVKLYNSSQVEVGTAVTDTNGYYEFDSDSTINNAPATLSKTVIFKETQTTFNRAGMLDQFDPSLGALQSIDFMHNGSITSTIQAENTSASSGQTVTGTVGGKLTLTGPGINQVLNLAQNAGSQWLDAFDGANNFGGMSGMTLAPKTSLGTARFTLNGAAMSPFIGTGQVSLHELGQAVSDLTGDSGNLVQSVQTTGSAEVDVVYHYIPGGCLQQGSYAIVETQPTGYDNGKDSSGGHVLPNPVGTDTIRVTLKDADSTNNNFGELKPADPPPDPPLALSPPVFSPPQCPPLQCPPCRTVYTWPTPPRTCDYDYYSYRVCRTSNHGCRQFEWTSSSLDDSCDDMAEPRVTSSCTDAEPSAHRLECGEQEPRNSCW